MKTFRTVSFFLLLHVSVAGAIAGDPPVALEPEEVPILLEYRLAIVSVDAKERKLWSAFCRQAGNRIGKTIRPVFIKNEAAGLKHLAEGKVEFSWVSPEAYVEEVGMKTGQAALAVLAPGRNYGFQVALMVRASSALETATDLLYSDLNVGVIQMAWNLKGRFYYGPLTDENLRISEEFKKRRVIVPDAKSLLERLKNNSGKRKIEAALIPLSGLGPLSEGHIRSGLREIWLSPLYPGPVIAARLQLSKLQRSEFAKALIAAGDSFEEIERFGIGGFKPATDDVFEPLREFVRKGSKR